MEPSLKWLLVGLLTISELVFVSRCEATRGEAYQFKMDHPRLSISWREWISDLARWHLVFSDGAMSDEEVAMAVSLNTAWGGQDPTAEAGLWMLLLSVPSELHDASLQETLVKRAAESEDLHAHLWLALRYPDRPVVRYAEEIRSILLERDQFPRTRAGDAKWAHEVPYLVPLRDFTNEQLRAALMDSIPGAWAVLDAASLQGINLYSRLDEVQVRRLSDESIVAQHLLLEGVLNSHDLDSYSAAGNRFLAGIRLGTGTMSKLVTSRWKGGKRLLSCRSRYVESSKSGQLREFFRACEPSLHEAMAWLLCRYHGDMIGEIAATGNEDEQIAHMLSFARRLVGSAPTGALDQVRSDLEQKSKGATRD